MLTHLALNENYIPLWKPILLKILNNFQELYIVYLGQKVNGLSPAGVSFCIAGIKQSTLAYFMCWVVYIFQFNLDGKVFQFWSSLTTETCIFKSLSIVASSQSFCSFSHYGVIRDTIHHYLHFSKFKSLLLGVETVIFTTCIIINVSTSLHSLQQNMIQNPVF